MLFSHESFKTLATRGNRNDGTRCGIWPCDRPLPPELVLGHPGFRPRIAVAVQFDHWEGSLRVSAWANNGVPRVGTYVLRVCSTEAMLEEDL